MSEDIPLAILGSGEQTRTMIYSEPILQPVDYKKEAELMRLGAARMLKDKKAALQSLLAAGIDPKTGRVRAK
jgi:hypothetical protein